MDARGRPEIAETTSVGPNTKRMLCRLGEHAQSRPTLCDPRLPGSSVYGISQARILDWVAISSSRGSSNPGIEPGSPTLAGRFFITEPPGKLLDWAFLLKSKICQILLKNNNFLKWELPGSPVVKGLRW